MTKQVKRRKARTYYVIIDSDNFTWHVSKLKKHCKEVIDDYNWGAFGCKIIQVVEVMPKKRGKR